jgi:uncharacterized FAD-dependent dehydrogenase
MKNKMYDVVVVGAGPAGIFCVYELIKKNPSLKIALVDMGKKLEERTDNDVMSGFGGACAYSDGKLIFSNSSHSKYLNFLSIRDLKKLFRYVKGIIETFHVKSVPYPKNSKKVALLLEETEKQNIELIVKDISHIQNGDLKKLLLRFQELLIRKNISLLFNTEVTDILKRNNKCIGVKTKDGHTIYSSFVVLAPGRINAKWLKDLAAHYGLSFQYDMVEIGVCVEFPKSIIRRYTDIIYDVTMKIRTNTYDDIIRTFNSCPNGQVVEEYFQGYTCVDGRSIIKKKSLNSNFGLLNEVHLTEPVENSISYAESITELAATIGGGKPILQRLEDLRHGRRSTWGRLNKSIVVPSLKDITPGDISMALPYRVVTNILEGLQKLDTIIPGINSGSTLLYAPEIKSRFTKIKTHNNLETDIKHLFVAGDASGLSGTTVGAAATGVLAGRGVLAKL